MLYVGIDVAKRSHEVVLLDDAGEARGKPFRIANSHVGLSRLIDRVEAHPTPEQIAELDLEQLTGLLQTPSRCPSGKHSRDRFGRSKAEQIQEAARHSFGVTLTLDALTAQLRPS